MREQMGEDVREAERDARWRPETVNYTGAMLSLSLSLLPPPRITRENNPGTGGA